MLGTEIKVPGVKNTSLIKHSAPNNTITSFGKNVKIKEAEFPQVAQRPDSKTIREALASTNNSISFSNKNSNKKG